MLFGPDLFLRRFEPLRRARRQAWASYGAAVAAVAIATGLRWAADGPLEAVPFITFFPAVVLATFVGGGRAGVLALVLSVVVANYMFLPPAFDFSMSRSNLIASGVFIAVSAVLIGLVSSLNRAVDRLWRQAESTRVILEAAPAGIIAVDDQGIIKLVNATLERQLGYVREELLGQSVDMLVPLGVRTSHGTLRNSFADSPAPRPMGVGRDLHAVRKDGSLVPVEVGLSPFRHDGVTGTLATIVDISERKALEWRAEILSREVTHRARNLLTVVQAVASRTLPREHRSTFFGTLEAIARTQDLFAAKASASLHSILDGELAAFRNQVTITDCDLLLTPRAAQDFTLIVHELTTNALKHGALSTAAGRILIDCRQDGRLLAFVWEEQGVQRVTPPVRQGFGRTILQDLAGAFSTSVDIDYHPSGLRYELQADLHSISDQGAGPAPASVSAKRTEPTEGDSA